MKKLIVLIMLVALCFGPVGGCATLTSDVPMNDAPTQNIVVKKAVSDHWWDLIKIGFGVTLGTIAEAVLINNW